MVRNSSHPPSPKTAEALKADQRCNLRTDYYFYHLDIFTGEYFDSIDTAIQLMTEPLWLTAQLEQKNAVISASGLET